MRNLLLAASVLGFLGVAAGAFGAHGLKSRLSQEMLEIFDTGVRYHLLHVLAVLASAWVLDRLQQPSALWAGWLFVAGILIFSGSLYMLSLTGTRWLGAVTPVGGVAFLAGWLCLAWAALR
ncbi:MAG TPA: DUF423 domain-containing protein [Acidobacteriota bacterium]|nr:DUF423 domain-containing protein [Acidobacteriota bacterium]